MGSDWESVALKDVAKFLSGGTPPKSNPEYWGGEIPWISAKSMYGSRFNNSELKLTKSGLEKGSRLAPKDATLLLVRGSMLHQRIPVGICTKEVAFNQDVKAVIPNKDFLPLYFYYCFAGREHELLSKVENTGIGAGKLDTEVLHKVKFFCPPLPEQKAIAHILGSLDDKIELNRQMNETLESMAQALFKSWFVDFDPVIDNALAAGNDIPDAFAARAELRKNTKQQIKGEVDANNAINPLFPSEFEYTEEMGWIPKGWGVVKLNELIDVKYGKDHKKLNDGLIPVYGSGGIMRFVDQSLFKGESVLIPRKGTLSNLMYVDEEFWSVDTMFFSVPKSEFIMKYVFYYLKTFDFVSMNVGSAVPSMTTKVLNDINTLNPDEVVLERFDNLISVYFNKKQLVVNNNNILSKLRDTLLPKLITGELRIPDAEKLIEEAL